MPDKATTDAPKAQKAKAPKVTESETRLGMRRVVDDGKTIVETVTGKNRYGKTVTVTTRPSGTLIHGKRIE